MNNDLPFFIMKVFPVMVPLINELITKLLVEQLLALPGCANNIADHCKICDYKCKKELTLHKHINTKHKNVRCKVCFNKFVSTIMMLQHMDEQ